MSCLPLAANSGQYVATGANGSSSPRSTSISATRAVTFLGASVAVLRQLTCPYHWNSCVAGEGPWCVWSDAAQETSSSAVVMSMTAAVPPCTP